MIALNDPRLPARFWAKVRPDDNGCWVWTAAKYPQGYAAFSIRRSVARPAHRVAYLTLIGCVGDGLVLDHLCRVRHCVNPAHLEPVTNAENIRRGLGGKYQTERTHCPKGHPYEGENLRLGRTKRGTLRRNCRECQNAATRARYWRNKAVTP